MDFSRITRILKGDVEGHTFHGNQWAKDGSVKGITISDQDLINAEHGNVSDKAVGWSFVIKKPDGSLQNLFLHVEPRFDPKSMAGEYGVRQFGVRARVVSSERIGREDEIGNAGCPSQPPPHV